MLEAWDYGGVSRLGRADAVVVVVGSGVRGLLFPVDLLKMGYGCDFEGGECDGLNEVGGKD